MEKFEEVSKGPLAPNMEKNKCNDEKPNNIRRSLQILVLVSSLQKYPITFIKGIKKCIKRHILKFQRRFMKGLSEIFLRRQVHTMYQHCMYATC